jgi:hypothetical protein
VTLDPKTRDKAYFGFLQVRPMVVSSEEVSVSITDLQAEQALLASETVMGNGIIDTITDIVYVKPDQLKKESSKNIGP